MESQLGKSTNRYTAKRWFHQYKESSFSMPYRVLWDNGSRIFVAYDRDEGTGELINFTSRTEYWISNGLYIEYFTKERVSSRPR